MHPPETSVHEQPFTASEWQAFRDSDKKAARNIVVLMVGIFLTGVMLYSIVVATL
jgi:hypothetical protein